MYRPAITLLMGVLTLGLPRSIHAADVEQTITHEDPLFKPRESRLAVGRDGRVYLSTAGQGAAGPYGFVLRLTREGKEKIGSTVPFAFSATANKDGVLATANPGYGGHRVAVYDDAFRVLGSVADFDVDNFLCPVHVEAGEGGDFYGLDMIRRQIVRISPAAKQVKTYTLPDGSPHANEKQNYRDFRVCEKTGAFYLLGQPNARIVCVGFDGKERWTFDGPVPMLVDDARYVGVYDVDEAGVLYVLDGETVKMFDPEGKPSGVISLQMGDAKPAPNNPGYGYLRIYGNDLLLRRSHPSELFRRYNRKTGALEQVVSTDHERLTVSFDSETWTAGQSIPLRVCLEAGGELLSPRWHVWARPFASLEYREFPLKDGVVQVPADCAGLYLIKVSLEVQPWQRAAACDHKVRAVVEIRQPNTKGSATVLTPENRTFYGRGEEIPFSVAVRAAEPGQAVKLTVRLMDGDQVISQGNAETKTGDEPLAFRIPATLTAALRPGSYNLAVAAPGLTCSDQPVIIGAGLRKPSFHLVQHGDFHQSYPSTDIWDAPDITAAHAARTAKVGLNLMVDRIGYHTQLWNLDWKEMRLQRVDNRAELDAIAKRLETDPHGVAPDRAAMATPLCQTQAAYSALGIEQMASLVSMDACLPLGTGFDPRKPEEFERDINRVTQALLPYPSFRGWSWAANWWIWENRGAKAAQDPAEAAAYTTALKRAAETGAWDPVLERVSGYRLGYAVAAQELFNTALKNIAPAKVTAVSGPYRNLEAYPPVTYCNVDEVQLHYQAEQLQWPNVAPHNVDYQKRPGKRAWGHPVLQNDAGTGDQILPAYFQMVMRGADGVGCSEPIPVFGPQPEDARSAYLGVPSVYRAANTLLREYGPFLATLENNDRVAIVVSGRMSRIDEWGNIGGRYFDRLFEAYQSCLRAHFPASFVFVEDLTPDLLKRFRAVLVVGQTVEMEPELAEGLRRAKDLGTVVFCDGTCRPGLVKDFTPLGTVFDRIGKDPSAWQDDSAYLRFPEHYRAHLPALAKALSPVVPSVAEVDNPEVLLSERIAGEGRYLFVVNDTMPDLDPGQIWRVTLAITSRVPVQVPVRLRDPGPAVYDVFARKRITPGDEVVDADLRSLPARLFAILPTSIARVELRGPKKVTAGQAFAWSAEVQDGDGKVIRASVPLRLRLLDAGRRVLDEQFTATGLKSASGTMYSVRNAAPGAQVLEVTELFSGQTVALSIMVAGAIGPANLTVAAEESDAPADAVTKSEGVGKGDVAAEALFGPHVRDFILTEGDSLAVASVMNWDHNLFAVDVKTGELRWRQRVGHYFSFSPQPLESGFAVQGYDLKSAEGYHLYMIGGDGKPERRFALYGLPQRCTHRWVPGLFLGDRISNFAAPPDGSWVASAGDLGLAVWSREGKLLWSQDWWKTGRHTAALAALGPNTLVTIEGMKATGYAARTGEQLWQVRLDSSGEVVKIVVGPDGKTFAVLNSEGGRVHVVRDGKVVVTIHGGATAKNLRHLSFTGDPFLGVTGVALSADGSQVAVTAGNLLRLYSVAGGLRWALPADDTLHSPRFSTDGERIAAGSELGTLYVVSSGGDILLERDLGALPVPAWLPDGDLLAGTWMGSLCRLDRNYAERWWTKLRPEARDMRGKLLAEDGIPTTRIVFQGNAEKTPASITPNLLDPKNAFVKYVWQNRDGNVDNGVLFGHDSTALVDGKPDSPTAPWIGWPQMNWYAEWNGSGEGSPFTYVLIDAYRTHLRVTGVTLVEDTAHPESWLRDAAFEYWDTIKERWVFVQPLLSDAATHTHKFATPVEASRFRIVLPRRLGGNLRLREIVFHGERLGPSHPDVVARRPVAVLFDEGNDLTGYLQRTTIALKGAYIGERCLTVGGEDAVSVAPWPEGMKVFGETLPNWDFEIVEDPVPGQYRYLQFAWRRLTGSKGVSLRLGNGGPDTVSLYAGVPPSGDVPNPKQVADAVPGEWTVVRVDLWEVFKKPVRIRAMRLANLGGSAAFDQILLGRTEKDLPPLPK